MIKKYRKKPVEVEAVLYDGTNVEEIRDWEKSAPESESRVGLKVGTDIMMVHTDSGVMEAKVGDHIIKRSNNVIYPCPPELFEESYEAID